MAVKIVRLGSPRAKGEGPRIGTVRRAPPGGPRGRFAKRDFYDVWLPDLAPSDALVKLGLAADDAKKWAAFVKKYRAEMKKPEAARLLALLAALSQSADFSVGCYCENEAHCHRSVLREILAEQGATIA